ncbi:sensor histidine kinase [Krasilnikovia sp. MM14-A1259]|uniref:sensor histidine kinase n=1 Tax=Krasilnikovia sp. MM14-A1259 TaxID=3373539 RepID=UPI00381D609E
MKLFAGHIWTLRRRVMTLCFAVGVVLTGLGLAAAIIAAHSNDHIDALVNRTGPMRIAGESLSTALVDQETAVRGFAISGKEASLQPYLSGRIAQQQNIERIDKALGPDGDPQVRAALQDVQRHADAWRTAVAEPVIAGVRRGGPDAAKAVRLAADTTTFDPVRTSVAQLQMLIAASREQSVDTARRTAGQLFVLEVTSAGIVLIAGAVLLILLDHLVTRPILGLAGQVRAVAAGNYDQRITSGGSPELRALAGDVDAMRRQIATELSEVREARAQIEWVNDQLKQQADELTRSNRDLEQFAYVASHDLQEPLRKVASFCQLLQRRYEGQLDERADQYIAFAVDGAQRMQRLINDLLAFSRIGRLTLGFTDVDLDRVLTQVASQLESRTGVDGRVEWAGLPTVEGEEALLTTLFTNLVGNSLKFHRPGVPPVVVISAEPGDREWLINVRDNGIGIEAEFADKVFVIFQRLHPRDAYEGTGIGLAIVKKIVEYHGGRIWLDLDVDEGTSIWFTLPAPVGVSAEPDRPTEPEQVPEPDHAAEPESDKEARR